MRVLLSLVAFVFAGSAFGGGTGEAEGAVPRRQRRAQARGAVQAAPAGVRQTRHRADVHRQARRPERRRTSAGTTRSMIYANHTKISAGAREGAAGVRRGREGVRPGPLRELLLPQLAEVHRAGRRAVPQSRHGHVPHRDREGRSRDHEGLQELQQLGRDLRPHQAQREGPHGSRSARGGRPEGAVDVGARRRARAACSTPRGDTTSARGGIPGFHNLLERGVRWACGQDPALAGAYVEPLNSTSRR